MIGLKFTAVLCSLLHLGLAADVTYPPCGTFSDDAPFDSRPLPDSYDDQGLVWILYTQDNTLLGTEFRISNGEVEIPDGYDSSKETKFLIHGWNSNRNTLQNMKDAYLEAGDVNVVIVDWEVGANELNYALSASNTRVIGACSAVAAEALGSPNFHCSGHSLGAHTCGYMGKGMNLERITAMDPAGPLFEGFDAEVRVDSSDASYVDVLHTQSPEDPVGDSLGMRLAVGHADFYPNDGGRQPGCATQLCDHNRAFEYMELSIVSPNCFPAQRCGANEDPDAGDCDTCIGDDCSFMGESAEDIGASGRYYLEIDEDFSNCP